MVPVPERTAETSLLYSCSKQISVKKPKNKKEVVVQVYAFYHKDIDATQKTAHLMINDLSLHLSLSRLLSNPNDFFISSSSSSSLQCNDNNDSVRITKIIVKNIADD
jgi:hypothetical protein